MKISIAVVSAFCCISVKALDLSPHFAAVESDGVSLCNPYFTDADKKFGLILNMETQLIPYEDGALFKFIKLDHAEMRLRHSPLGVELKFGPDTVAAYEQAARSLLPQLAEGVVLEKEINDPLPMNAWKSHRFLFKYTMRAFPMRESITFLNILPTEQVVVQVYAREQQFENAAWRADDIIRRWYELEPSKKVRNAN